MRSASKSQRWFRAPFPSRASALTTALLACLAMAGCEESPADPALPGPSGGSGPTGGASNPGATTGGNSLSAGNGAIATGGTAVAGAGMGGSLNGGSLNGGGGSSGGSVGGATGGASVATGGTALGGAGVAGSGGDIGMAGSGGKIGTGKHQFPINQRLERCTYPTNVDPAHAHSAYQRWKTDVVTADGARGHLRVKRPNSPGAETNSTVSEGIAYGMIIAVAMGDQPLFDSLWKYSQEFLNENGLMHWYINAAGTQVLGSGGATDSDEDIAWSLVMADRQWGGSGSLSAPYLELAKLQIQRIWEHEIDHDANDLVKAGDTWQELVFNPSYFAPNQYRIFGAVSGKVAEWDRVIDSGYAALEKCLNAQNGNAENGLAPAWCNTEGAPTGTNGASNYQYDSARVPFRIGQDYCYSGDPRALAYLQKVSAFFAGVGAGNIVDGYALDGSPEPDPASDPNGPQSAVFVGSAAVGAMHDAKFQSFIDDAYGRVATGELLARSIYYNMSWTTLSLLMLSGNLVEFAP